MKVEDTLIREIAALQQRIIELELSHNDHSIKHEDHRFASSGKWFTTGSPAIYVDYEHKVNECAKYRFSDLLDIGILQNLLNSFYVSVKYRTPIDQELVVVSSF